MIKPNILPISNTGMTIFTEVMLISLIFFMFLDQKIRAVKKKNMSIYINIYFVFSFIIRLRCTFDQKNWSFFLTVVPVHSVHWGINLPAPPPTSPPLKNTTLL